jgi:hypothetical protein
MISLSHGFMSGLLFAALGSIVACGSSDDDSSGSSGKGGTSTTGGTSGTSSGGTSGTTGGTSGKGGSSSGGSTSTGGSSGTTSGGGKGGSSGSSGSGGSGGSIPVATTCPAFSACGGDVVGTWKASSLCGTLGGDMSMPECADAVKSVSASGDPTYTFKSDKTWTLTGTAMIEEELSVNDACAQANQVPDAQTYCAYLELFGGLAGGSITFDCTYTAPNCNCHVSGAGDVGQSGTYAISGTQIDIVQGDGSGDSNYDYCVSGSTLTLSDPATQQQSAYARQ